MMNAKRELIREIRRRLQRPGQGGFLLFVCTFFLFLVLIFALPVITKPLSIELPFIWETFLGIFLIAFTIALLIFSASRVIGDRRAVRLLDDNQARALTQEVTDCTVEKPVIWLLTGKHLILLETYIVIIPFEEIKHIRTVKSSMSIGLAEVYLQIRTDNGRMHSIGATCARCFNIESRLAGVVRYITSLSPGIVLDEGKSVIPL